MKTCVPGELNRNPRNVTGPILYNDKCSICIPPHILFLRGKSERPPQYDQWKFFKACNELCIHQACINTAREHLNLFDLLSLNDNDASGEFR